MDERGRQEALRRAATAAGVDDPRVLDAVERVPRSWFAPTRAGDAVAADAPIGIGHGQTTSQPSLVARILQELQVEPGMSVLEVGTGLGYEAALATVLASPGGTVLTIERDARLGAQARERLQRLPELLGDIAVDVEVRIGDGSIGAEDHAPYDAIVVAAACDEVPPALIEQLAEGGRLVAPVRRLLGTRLLRLERLDDHVAVTADLGEVRYVPLRPGTAGRQGPEVGPSSGNALHMGADNEA